MNGCSIEVAAGESVCVVGSSGAGKTSLLWVLAGLIAPTEGAVRIQGVSLRDVSRSERLRLRRRSLGLVLQHGELVPDLTVLDNVSLPLRLLGVRARDAAGRSQQILERLGIGDLASRFPEEVSGGERQRAAVARAVVHHPTVILADEPTGSLDAVSAHEVLDCLFGLAREEGAALVVVTHSEDVASMTDRQLELRSGRLSEVAR